MEWVVKDRLELNGINKKEILTKIESRDVNMFKRYISLHHCDELGRRQVPNKVSHMHPESPKEP